MNNEEFQKKADSGRKLIDTLASLKLTVFLLVLSMILVLLGTLEQVHWGVWHVQKVYFSSWLCFYPMDPTAAFRFPLPAGFTIGALLMLNLGFAHFRHFKATSAKIGITMIHAGLLLLLGGGFITGGDTPVGRRLIRRDDGPLFGSITEPDDIESGTIYVLRSRSDHPLVAEHRDIIHKIGVTSAAVESRIAGAEKQSTYLLAAVDLVATYKVYDVNCQKLEGLIHKVFASAQIDLTLPDRFGNPVKPREWFLVPIAVIDEAVQRIRDRSILDYRYDPALGRLVKAAD